MMNMFLSIRQFAAVIFVGVLSVMTVSAADPPPAKDLDKLQGKWQVMTFAIGDQVFKRGGDVGIWKTVFDAELFFKDDRFGTTGYSNSKVVLDVTREPKQITLPDDDGKLVFRGIYELDGDTLKVCMNGDGNDVRRPEEFTTKKGTPLLLITLKKR